MKEKLLVLLFVVLSLPCSGQLLYEISGNSALGKSYLFATSRLCPISFLDTVPNLFKSFGRCDKVITEMAVYDFQVKHTLEQSALLPDSVVLRNFYTIDQYNEIDQALLLTLQMGLDKLGRLRPSYLVTLYRNELLRKWLNYDENRSSEVFFQEVAAERAMPLYALDNTGESFYMLFEREPLHWQFEELLHIVQYPEREVNLEKTLLADYYRGDLTQLAYDVSSPNNLSTYSYSDYKVFCDRNKTWVKRLNPYLHEGGAFICLDAVYLGSDNGLLALLRAAGYKVKPVNKPLR